MGADLAVWHLTPWDMALVLPGMTLVLAARPESLRRSFTTKRYALHYQQLGSSQAWPRQQKCPAKAHLRE